MCIDKGSYLNLDLMISSNYVVIMIMLMFIYVYMYVCMYVMSERVIMDYDCFMLIFMYMYLCTYVTILKGNEGSFLWNNDFLCR